MEKEISVPENVQVTLEKTAVSVKGKQGELRKEFNLKKFKIKQEPGKILLSSDSEKSKDKAMLGTTTAHIQNMINGVDKGFIYTLKIIYAHFPINVSVEGNKVIIKNFQGEKKPRSAEIWGKTKVEIKGQEIFVSGPDVEKVGQTSARIEEATAVRKKDRRVFQDGIFLVNRG